MAGTKISSADYTATHAIDYSDTVAGKTADDKFSLSVANASEENLEEYIPNWKKWKGYYDSVPQLRAVIHKKAMWTSGKGFSADEKTKRALEKINGFGKDSFNSILFNQIVSYTICGDSFAEIVRNNGRLVNLKPINPGNVKIIGSEFGRLKRYELWSGGKKTDSFATDEILHMPWNRLADAIHGTGTVEGVEDIILFHKEAMADMKIVFHRYVKPLIISSVDTDDENEIAAYKTKLEKSIQLGENLVVPKGTVDSIERVSIPQYSTLDPLPWINMLDYQFMRAEGVPEVILGSGKETTEATSKILYLAFQQMIEWNQLFVEECVKSQLEIKINLKFPANIAPDLQAGNAKAKKTNNFEMGIGQNIGG